MSWASCGSTGQAIDGIYRTLNCRWWPLECRPSGAAEAERKQPANGRRSR